MIDTVMYAITKDNPAGPVIQLDQPFADRLEISEDDQEATRGKLIGGVIAAGLLISLGIYLALTL